MATWKDAHDALAGKLAETEAKLAAAEYKLEIAIDALSALTGKAFPKLIREYAIKIIAAIRAAKGGK